MAYPLISIILPLYNKASYVSKAVESVKAQSFTQWECIIIDDGSTDNSLALATEAVHGDSRFTLIQQENSGVAVARNRAARKSQASLLAFLDADDWWHSDYLACMMSLIADYPDADLFASNYIYYKPGKTRTAVSHPTGYMDYPKAYLQSAAMPIWTGATMIRRQVFFDNGGFPAGIALGEDSLLWIKVSFAHKIAFLNTPLAYYNNDIPVRFRATRHLYPPSQNMLFHLPTPPHDRAADYHALYDKLRLTGLQDYWLSSKYHLAAKKELEKMQTIPFSEAQLQSSPQLSIINYQLLIDLRSWYSRNIILERLKRHIFSFGANMKHIIRNL